MSPDPQTTPPDPNAPHPLERVREQAAQTTTAAARAALDDLTTTQMTGLQEAQWSAAAEEVFRTAIGMERKSQLEMRVSLGDEGAAFIRRTAPLGEMKLAELQSEYREGRQLTLALLDRVLTAPEARPWTLGEQVAPDIYIVALNNRLENLGHDVTAEKI